ncbi:Uncharacterised protein [Bordetella pertussis]|nr:Uncharacterised protein [Bordetella pertussis]
MLQRVVHRRGVDRDGRHLRHALRIRDTRRSGLGARAGGNGAQGKHEERGHEGGLRLPARRARTAGSRTRHEISPVWPRKTRILL